MLNAVQTYIVEGINDGLLNMTLIDNGIITTIFKQVLNIVLIGFDPDKFPNNYMPAKESSYYSNKSKVWDLSRFRKINEDRL